MSTLSRRRRRSNFIVNTILSISCLVFLAPIAWMALLALKSPSELAALPVSFLPAAPQWHN